MVRYYNSTMARFFCIAVSILFGAVHNIVSQPIDAARYTDQVNLYAIVLNVDTCTSSLTVDLPNIVKPGDRVLIHQIYGAEIDTTESASFGTLTNLKNAGMFEFGTVAEVVQNKVFLSHKLIHTYEPENAVQMIKVAYAQNAIIQRTLTAPPFNGTTGGVLALEIADTLFMRAGANVSGAGFRGGMRSINKKDTSELRYRFTPTSGDGAGKGESFLRTSALFTHGRGAQATGGGGGNARNGGGGGGALGGSGGHGGWQVSQFPFEDVGGKGALPVYDTLDEIRMLFGAGGGGGHENDFQGTAGGNGGGIIVVRASVIVCSDIAAILNVNGITANTSAGDGSGGGGSAGMVIIEAGSINGMLVIEENGGDGGNSNGDDYCYAPGGGGGGGATILTSTSTASITSLTVSRRGGRAGVYTGNSNQCSGNQQYGATDGTAGVLWNFGTLSQGTVPVRRIVVQPLQDSACYNSEIEFSVRGGNVRWITPGVIELNSRIFSSPLKKTQYYVYELTTATGCTIIDSVLVTMYAIPDTSIYGQSSMCLGATNEYKINTGGMRRVDWYKDSQPVGATFPAIDSVINISATSTGILEVKAVITDTNTCTYISHFYVAVSDTLKPTVFGDSILCPNSTIVLTTDPYDEYLWSTGQRTQSITVTTPGTYSVFVRDNNCQGNSRVKTITTGVEAKPVLISTKEVFGENDSAIVRVTQKYARYIWMDGSTADSLVVRTTQDVSVIVYTDEGCLGNSDTLRITKDIARTQLLFSTNSISGMPGATAIITITAHGYGDLPASIVVTGTIVTNATMVVPQIPGFTTAGSELAIPFRFDIPANFSGILEASYPVTIVLGNSITDELNIAFASQQNGVELIVDSTGTVETEGVCIEGGKVRLFNPMFPQGSGVIYYDVLGRMFSTEITPTNSRYPLFGLPIRK